MLGRGVGGCWWHVSVVAGLVAAAEIQPQAQLGAYKPLHWMRMNGNADIQYASIHAYTDSRRKYFNSSAVIHSGMTPIFK